MINAKQKKAFRSELLERRDQLLEMVEDTKQALRFLEESRPIEFSEEAQEEALSAGLKGLDDQAWQELVDIERAFVKLENETYGICEKCGSEIGLKRLKARPMARYCLPCQEEMENS